MVQKEKQVLAQAESLLLEARALPRHSMRLWRGDVGSVSDRKKSFEEGLDCFYSKSSWGDLVKFQMSEVNSIINDCRYHQVCTVFVYLLIGILLFTFRGLL